MFHKIYEGSFLSRGGITWTASILRDQASAPASVGELDFPSESPLVISWLETSKEDVICGSTATLTVISPGDRTYIGLYTETPGSVRLEIRRGSSLYWSGALDPEFYEEPYAYGRNYDVSFSFSDFGLLKRLPYNKTGVVTLQSIINDALSRLAINYGTLNTSLITTHFDNSTLITLSTIKVRSDNFYDEDDVAMNLYDVIEGILRPLALRMVQKAGNIYLYDLNGLAESDTTIDIGWALEDQMLSVDKVFNNIKVTLSTYVAAAKTEDFEYTGSTPVEKVNLSSDTPDDGDYYSFYPDYDSDWDYTNVSFTIFQDQSAKGLQYIHPQMKYFKIVPMLGAAECEGVRQWFHVGHSETAITRKGMAYDAVDDGTALIKTKPLYLAALQTASDRRLKIVLEMLMDWRYNPFSEPGTYNSESKYNSARTNIRQVDVPVKVEIVDANGTVLYHYTNSTPRDTLYTSNRVTIERTKGSWEAGAAAYNDCVLRYYGLKEDEYKFLGGWVGNRHAINPIMQMVTGYAPLSASLLAADDGQYIPYPPVAGDLVVTVCAGIKIYMLHLESGGTVTRIDQTSSAMPVVKWLLYKAPAVSIVNNNLIYDDADTDDIEYTGVANINAMEDLELNEICGTMSEPAPTARGLLLKSDGTPVSSLIRAQRTATAEQLLIGTLYSQFAGRKTVLKGTAVSIGSGLCLRRDIRMSSARLMELGSTEDCIEDETQLTVVELSEDNYTSGS